MSVVSVAQVREIVEDLSWNISLSCGSDVKYPAETKSISLRHICTPRMIYAYSKTLKGNESDSGNFQNHKSTKTYT